MSHSAGRFFSKLRLDLRLTKAAGIVKWIIMELGWDFNGALLNQITEGNVHHGDPHKARAVVG